MEIGNRNIFSLRIVSMKCKNLGDELNIFMIIYRGLSEQESQIKDVLESVVCRLKQYYSPKRVELSFQKCSSQVKEEKGLTT